MKVISMVNKNHKSRKMFSSTNKYTRNKIAEICRTAIGAGYIKIDDLWLVLGFEDCFPYEQLKKLYDDFKCEQLRGLPQRPPPPWPFEKKEYYIKRRPLDGEDCYHSRCGYIWKYILYRWAAISRGNNEDHFISMQPYYRRLTPYEFNRAINEFYKKVPRKEDATQGSHDYIKLSELRDAFKKLKLPIPQLLADARKDKEIYVSDDVKKFLIAIKKSGEIEKAYKLGVAKELKNYEPNAAKDRTLKSLQYHPNKFVTRQVIRDASLYNGLTPGKEKRTFEGKLIHKIVSETFKNERVPGDYQKLYQVYKGLK